MLYLFRKDTFRHGVHPPEMKDDTAELAIRQFPFAPVLIVPLSQHLGAPTRAVVAAGEQVVRGQLIAEPGGFVTPAAAMGDALIERLEAGAASIGIRELWLLTTDADGNPIRVLEARSN